MPAKHNLFTIAAIAVIASAGATLLHEGVGHGVVAWLRGAVPTELTSNHLTSLHEDRWVLAGGTLVNLAVGIFALLASYRAGKCATLRYFLWLFAAFNLLSGTGYFLFSGIGDVGDWHAIIVGLPHQVALRIAMSVFGFASYFFVVRQLAAAVRPFVARQSDYNPVGRWPYLVAGIFGIVAGLLDPMGIRLLFLSTVPAAFGGHSGLLWADTQLPREVPDSPLYVGRSPRWWATALVLGSAYVAILGPGLRLSH